MSDDPLPPHINIIAMDPSTTSTPPSPTASEEYRFTVVTGTNIPPSAIEDDRPHHDSAPHSPHYSPQSPTPAPQEVISIYSQSPDPLSVQPRCMPDWPWVNRNNYPEVASTTFTLGTGLRPEYLTYTHLGIEHFSGEPTTYATDGVNQPQYGQPLETKPLPRREIYGTIDDLEGTPPIGEEYAMDPVLNKVIWALDDPGIAADIYRVRAEDARTRDLASWKKKGQKA
jgi:hypothetical protein